MEQQHKIDCTIGVCRLVYNLALSIKINAYREQRKRVSAIDLCSQLPDLRKAYPWIEAVNSQALQMSIRKVDIAFENFFRGKGYPKFKSRRNGGSFQCPQHVHINREQSTLTIPKIKDIPIVLSRHFEGKIKTVTISKTPTGKYFASILVDTGVPLPALQPVDRDKAVGIDLGIKDFAVTSTGVKHSNPKHLKAVIDRIAVLSRRKRHKKKGSANFKKANLRIALLHEKAVNQRKDFLQKLSTELVRDNQTTTLCVESLAVSNMVKNHSLAQAISDAGWSMFVDILRYKCAWQGKNLIEIGRFEVSTKTCSNCKARIETLTLAEREWTCPQCLSTHDRDINAAINIKLVGLTNSGRGTPVAPVEKCSIEHSVKQEVSN